MSSKGTVWGLAALMTLGLVVLARGLPAETFFVGDPGVKLIAARHAIAAPLAPLSLPLPSIGNERVPYVEPFFLVHGDHTHAMTSEIFPIASAPLIALVGIRGAYILPAIGFLLAVAGCVAIGQRLDNRRPAAVLLLTTALGTPLLFYGLEFWEHAPAAGAAAVATALWLRKRALPAGILFGVAVLLRPEAIAFIVAVAIASRFLSAPPPTTAVATAAGGLLIAVLPLAIYSLVHFHSVLPPHISSHSERMTDDWLAAQALVAGAWFVPRAFEIAEWWGVALILTALSGLFVPSEHRARRFLVAATLIDIVLVVLTAPNDGGGQWGPRYLMFGYIPAAILLSDVAETLSRTAVGTFPSSLASSMKELRRTSRSGASLAGALAVIVLIVAGVWAQRDGYRRLRTTKMIYGQVLDFVRRETPPAGIVVTDLWWLDQVAAAATEDRQFLFVADGTGETVMRALAQAGVSRVTVVRSVDESPGEGEWITTACYETEPKSAIPERGLTATVVERRVPCS